jgi:DNA polymerase I-like protein with 3'-5' exonuclease and polymerase domains
MQNPFCAANLVGSKEAGTDTHTLNAIACGIDRGIAKNLGYGSTYLQGMKSRIALLERAGLSREVAIEKARVFTESFIEGLAKSYFQGIRLLTENRSSTLLLGKRVPLAYQYSGDEGLTSRVNHNIQALGEDMLNVITAIVESEIGGFSEDCNLILTRHDELVFHCRDHLVDQLSEALQVAHYTTRRAIMDLIGITVDAPDPWMHFQGIDVGNRYRKSPSSRASTVTTTFPEENNEH